jgi:hypothetical protein
MLLSEINRLPLSITDNDYVRLCRLLPYSEFCSISYPQYRRQAKLFLSYYPQARRCK